MARIRLTSITTLFVAGAAAAGIAAAPIAVAAPASAQPAGIAPAPMDPGWGCDCRGWGWGGDDQGGWGGGWWWPHWGGGGDWRGGNWGWRGGGDWGEVREQFGILLPLDCVGFAVAPPLGRQAGMRQGAENLAPGQDHGGQSGGLGWRERESGPEDARACQRSDDAGHLHRPV